MQIKNIYAGSWLPRTGLHLQEFATFLGSGQSHLNLDEEKLKHLQQQLRVKNLQLDVTQKTLTAELDKLNFTYQANGLIVISKKVEDLKNDIEYLGDFSLNKIFAAFSYIYSLGAPIPKIFTALFSVMPFIVTVSKATKAEIKQIFSDHHKEIKNELAGTNGQIYFSDDLIVINNGNGHELELVKNLIFIEDCRNQFQKILNLHRFIWEETDKIKQRPKLPYRNLSLIRDTLLELNNEVLFFDSRLAQINSLLQEQTADCQKISDAHTKQYLSDIYEDLNQTANYISDLWKMTENNVQSTLNLITMLYQESTQKQLNILQVIFVMSAMGSLIALGSIYGFDFTAFDEAGNLVLKGSTKSFTFFDLFRFGGSALLVGALGYFIFIKLYNKLSHSKLTSQEKIQTQEINSIKKMFK